MFVDAVHQKAVLFGWFLHKIMIPADTQLKEVKPGLQRLKEGSASVQLLWQPGQASVSYLMTLPACPSCSFDFSYNWRDTWRYSIQSSGQEDHALNPIFPHLLGTSEIIWLPMWFSPQNNNAFLGYATAFAISSVEKYPKKPHTTNKKHRCPSAPKQQQQNPPHHELFSSSVIDDCVCCGV